MKRNIWTVLTAVLCLAGILTACGAPGTMKPMDDQKGGTVYPGSPAEKANYALPEREGAPEETDATSVSNPSKDPVDSIERTPLSEYPWTNAAEEAQSTFSADVDTASYTILRRLIADNYPESFIRNQFVFRTEEMINYFRIAGKQPEGDDLFGVTAEIAPCPWGAASELLILNLATKKDTEKKPGNYVFLVDVSGSMNGADRIELLKKAFRYLTVNLTEQDTVSIVTYASNCKTVLAGCPGNQTARILEAVNSLEAGGATYGERGLQTAYSVARDFFKEDGNNRIILASDGDFNVGLSSVEELQEYIENMRKERVYLSVLGFGYGNFRDEVMETLADKGNGVYYYIDSDREAERVFGTELASTLYTVADDVKLQLTFDPQYIEAYRLIGYENRALNNEDFEDDTKDAGEVGTGHTVTVAYQIRLTQKAKDELGGTANWMKLAVRYKDPGQTQSRLNEYEIGAGAYRKTGSETFRFLGIVIETSMWLNGSGYLPKSASLDWILEQASDLEAFDNPENPDFYEFFTLIRKLNENSKKEG